MFWLMIPIFVCLSIRPSNVLIENHQNSEMISLNKIKSNERMKELMPRCTIVNGATGDFMLSIDIEIREKILNLNNQIMN